MVAHAKGKLTLEVEKVRVPPSGRRYGYPQKA